MADTKKFGTGEGMPTPMSKDPELAKRQAVEERSTGSLFPIFANPKNQQPIPKPTPTPVSTQPVRDVPKTGTPAPSAQDLSKILSGLNRPVIPPRPRIPPPRPPTPVPPRPATPVDPIPQPRPVPSKPSVMGFPDPVPPVKRAVARAMPTNNPAPMNSVPMNSAPMNPAMMKKGGAVKASKRADGIAQRGKTKGRMI